MISHRHTGVPNVAGHTECTEPGTWSVPTTLDRIGFMVLRGFLQKLTQGLAKTRDVLGIGQLFGLRGKVDRDFLDKFEKRLYLADFGTVVTAEIVDSVRQSF